MSDSLNSQDFRTIQGLYTISPNFRTNFVKLVKDELTKAKNLMNSLSFDGSSVVDEKPTSPKKKRGRPTGSKNKAPSKPRAKKDAVVPTEETVKVSSELTHKNAIVMALAGAPEGLTAKDVYNSIVASKHKKYKAPTMPTLYTTLHGMKTDGLVNISGERPNSRYILP